MPIPTFKISVSQARIHPPQFAKRAVESYAQGHGRTGHSDVYFEDLQTTVADACKAKITIAELRGHLAAAELGGIDQRDLLELMGVVKSMEKAGIGFDKLREVREVVLLGGRVAFGGGRVRAVA